MSGEYNQWLYKPERQQTASVRHFSSSGKFILEIGSEDDFDKIVYHSTKPIIAQFYADSNGPSRNLIRRLEAKVRGENGKVQKLIILVKVNVESGSSIAERFQVKTVPTVLCFKNGKKVNNFQGDVDDAYLDQIITNLMR